MKFSNFRLCKRSAKTTAPSSCSTRFKPAADRPVRCGLTSISTCRNRRTLFHSGKGYYKVILFVTPSLPLIPPKEGKRKTLDYGYSLLREEDIFTKANLLVRRYNIVKDKLAFYLTLLQ